MGIGDRLKGLVSRRKNTSGDMDIDDLDDDILADDDDDEMSDPEARRGAPLRRIAISLGALCLLGALGAGGWFLLIGNGGNAGSGFPSVVMDVPPRTGGVLHAPGNGNSPGAAPLRSDSGVAATSTGETTHVEAPPSGGSGAQAQAENDHPTVADPPAAPEMDHGGSNAPKTLNEIATVAEEPGRGVVIPGVSKASFAAAAVAPAKPLPEVPIAALVEQGPAGPLPKIAADGRKPWKTYAAPSPHSRGFPRIAVLVEEIGLSRGIAEIAIEHLPGPVSFVVSPYAADIPEWIAASRRSGHEVFLGVPMEPNRFPARDAGPLALQTVVSVSENAVKLDEILAKGTGYVGITPVMGGRFLSTLNQVRSVFETLKMRGLMYVDTRSGDHSAVEKAGAETMIPLVKADILLDDTLSEAAIDFRLAELESLARKKNGAMAVVKPSPVALKRLSSWSRTLEGKKLALVPVSALVEGKDL